MLIIVLVTYFVSAELFNTWKCNTENFQNEPMCTAECASNSKLLPILEPEFNLRECAKQMILLEDHLNNPRKRCQQCIRKHMLTIEGLAEEGVTLDKEGTCKDECEMVAEEIRKCEKMLIDGKKPENVAQEIRLIRKPLMVKYFDSIYKKEHTEENIPIAKSI
jgi:hypothetical protein